MRRAIVLLLGIPLLCSACSVSPQTLEARTQLHDDVTGFLNTIQRNEPDLASSLKTTAGYVVFPSIIKLGFGLEGAYGRGEVYQNGKRIGYADTTEYMIGAAAGGQAFGELIVFSNQSALDDFKNRRAVFAADASAIFTYYGVAATNDYSDDVVEFPRPCIGYMFEAAVGAQTFNFEAARPPTSRVIVMEMRENWPPMGHQ